MLVMASWNMAQAWSHSRPIAVVVPKTLEKSKGAQVFLLQEAARPPSTSCRTQPQHNHPDEWVLPVPRSQRLYCSAIACADPALAFKPRTAAPLSTAAYGEFCASHPGQFAVADVYLESYESYESVTVVSLYGLWDRVGADGDLYAISVSVVS